MAVRGGRKGAKAGGAAGGGRKRPASSRKRLTPRREARGPDAAEMALPLTASELAGLAEAVRRAGGAPLGAYREPLGGRPLLLASLPRQAVEPTPFQRDLSPTHTKRLAAKIEEAGLFLDPLIAVLGEGGVFWTPNGRHRLAAARVLGMRQVPVLLCPDEALAFRILALNTEKAHNLKDRSLEAIRMARALAQRHPKHREVDHAEELEGAELLTLGLVYEREPRFAGGAYAPMLRRVDRFQTRSLAASLREREGLAARLRALDERVKEAVAGLRARGFDSPYLRNLVVARINPVRFHRARAGDAAPPMTLAAALTRMTAALRRFDPAQVRERDLALVAAASGD